MYACFNVYMQVRIHVYVCIRVLQPPPHPTSLPPQTTTTRDHYQGVLSAHPTSPSPTLVPCELCLVSRPSPSVPPHFLEAPPHFLEEDKRTSVYICAHKVSTFAKRAKYGPAKENSYCCQSQPEYIVKH